MMSSVREARSGSGAAGAGVAHLYAADCPGLRAWSRAVGLRALHVSVAADPTPRIAALRRSARARDRSTGVRADGDAWRLVPLGRMAAHHPLPPGCTRRGQSIRVRLPAGASDRDLSARLAVFLEPLDALALGRSPSAAITRALQERLLPAMPRHAGPHGAPTPVRDLYRIEGGDDVGYVMDALDAALTALGGERAAFDRAFAALGGLPSADDRAWVPFDGMAA